jgi:hypothetical protein
MIIKTGIDVNRHGNDLHSDIHDMTIIHFITNLVGLSNLKMSKLINFGSGLIHPTFKTYFKI